MTPCSSTSTSTLQERTCGRRHTKNTPALVSPCMESSLAVNCTGAMWIVDVRKLLFSSAQQRWGSIWTNVSTHTLPSPIGMLFPIGTCSKEDGHRPRAHDLEGESKVFQSSKEEAEWSSKILQPFTILADSTTGASEHKLQLGKFKINMRERQVIRRVVQLWI